MTTTTDDGKWHLDKKIPLALIMTLIVQSMALVGGAVSFYARVGNLESKVADMAALPEKVARLEGKFDAVKEDTTEIKLLLRNARR